MLFRSSRKTRWYHCWRLNLALVGDQRRGLGFCELPKSSLNSAGLTPEDVVEMVGSLILLLPRGGLRRYGPCRYMRRRANLFGDLSNIHGHHLLTGLGGAGGWRRSSHPSRLWQGLRQLRRAGRPFPACCCSSPLLLGRPLAAGVHTASA